MVVWGSLSRCAGLPDPETLPEKKQRALAMVALAFSMVHVMDIINSDDVILALRLPKPLQCQVGIHSGGAIAGIIGHKTFQYDLCGDAVNTAARMCSYSKPGHVNISETTYQLLKDKFGAVPRGELNIKDQHVPCRALQSVTHAQGERPLLLF